MIAAEQAANGRHGATGEPDIWRALANPFRRQLLDTLSHGPRTTGELAEAASDLSRFAVMQHLDVLTDAGLITRSKTGRTVTCQITPAPMEQAMNWLAHYERYWTEQLDRLAAFLEEDSWQANPASPSSGASKRRRRSSSKPGRSRKK